MHFGIWKFIVVGKEDYRVIIIASTVGMHKTVLVRECISRLRGPWNVPMKYFNIISCINGNMSS